MDNITQFVFMLHGFAKFNEVQPNIKQWNKIHDEYLKTTIIDSRQDLVSVAVAPTTYQELIVAINNVEQVPTSAQWREIKAITEKTIDQIRMEVDLDELYVERMDDIGCYEIEDDFLPTMHYESNDVVINPTINPACDSMYTLTNTSGQLNNLNFTINVIDDNLHILDDFVAKSFTQKSFNF